MNCESEQGIPSPNKILLHACCGPCSLEPARVLSEEGQPFDVFYSNGNIYPPEEYDHRLSTLLEWADTDGITVVEDCYNPAEWEKTVGCIGEAQVAKYGVIVDPTLKEQPEEALAMRASRCRACYRMRFEQAAQHASAHGYTSLSTTLSVSPYQYTDIIREELERACQSYGLEARFVDWRPYYPQATKRSLEAGMYRQNYCGCRFSIDEAEAERQLRKEARKAAKAARKQAHEQENAEKEAALAATRQKKASYANERARRRAILKSLRNSNEN